MSADQTISNPPSNSRSLNTLHQLREAGLWHNGRPLRLHLGCGESYLDGYINIDHPPSEHNVMQFKADLYTDIRQLQFPTGCVDEIRLHHVFEHFNRVTALVMLIKWQDWLKVGGVLRIETPDMMESARTLLSDAPWLTKMATVRHLVGDQAATWAYHLDGWFSERFERTFKLLGFEGVKSRSSAWDHEPYLSNVEVIALKSGHRPLEVQLRMGEELLLESTVSRAERPTYETWTAQLRAALSGTFPASPSNVQMPISGPLTLAAAALARNGSSLPLDEIHDFNQRHRDRWIAAKAHAVPAGARVLDLGAGTCQYRLLFSHCEYKTHDFKQYTGNEKLGGTSEYGQMDYVSDITAIPVPDHSFDVIICTEVLEHVPEPIEVLREIGRILRPGGRAFITAPLGSGLHQLPYHFYGGFTPEWYRHFCPRFSLKVNEVVPNGGFFKLLAQECARVTWTLLQHPHLLGSESEALRQLFGELLPRYLFALDDKCFMDKFTVGYHVEAVKVGHNCGSESTQTTASTVVRSAIEHSQTVGIVFSKDRAFQLDGTLRSFLSHCQDSDQVALKVLYRASDETHQRQYQQLAADYPFVEFLPEQIFKTDLLSSIAESRQVLFLVDDNIFVRDFWMNEVADQLKAHPEALGFSLRLGKNTTYCYPLNAMQRVPEFQAIGRAILTYDWTVAEHDFGYPLEVSSSVYRTREIVPLLEQLDFRDPNTLEAQLATRASGFRTNRNRLLCYEQSVTFCAPINMVQTTCRNRAGSKSEHSPEKLALLFDEGFRLKAETYSDFTPHACHQETELTLQQIEGAWPMVSVVIPCYNQAQHLPEAVESLVKQTFHNWECIIVNDGSPDQTSQVARDLIARYPGKRIRLLEKKNGGLADARNAGIAASHGRYILPLDADDVLKPYALARLVEVLETQSDVAIVYPDYETFGTQSRVIHCIDEHLFLDAARLKNGLPSCSGLPYCSLYRRDVWSKVGGYNPNMIWGYEDWDFWIGCFEKGFRARRVPEPLFLYRVKPGSMYSNALKHDAELKARIILNHSALFDEAVRQRAETVLQAPVTSGLSAGERPPQAIPAEAQPTAVPSPPEVSDSKWPPEVTAHVRQAEDHLLKGDLPATRDSLREALVIVPRDPQLIIAYGNVVLRLGDVEGARREFVKTTTLHPTCGPAHLNLAAVLVMLERRDEAECSVRQALILNPNDVDALKLLGRIHLESGRHVEGVQTYADALRQSPDDMETLLALGKCAVEISDLATAQTMYERALKLAPDNDLARENLEIVKERTKADVGVVHAPVGTSIIHSSETTHAKEGRQSKASETKPSGHHGSVLAMSGSTLRAPMVSVIVPTYNRPDTLLDALRSILNQTYQDFEIIVVNDAGSDVENIVRFLDKDDRITYIRHGSNRNLAAARNTGIRVARGKYIAYLDDDDLYCPDHLQTLVTFLEQSECKVAYTDAYRAHQEKRDGRYVVSGRDIPYSFDFDHDRILIHNFVPVLCFMHERACLDAVGLFDESLTTHEDWELWIRLSRRYQFVHIKKVTCEFSSRTDGSTMTSSKLSDFRRTYTIILERYKASTADKPHIRAAQNRLLQSMREKTASTDVATQPAWPAEVIERVRQAEHHLVQGDPPAAAQALSQALQLVPHDPELIVAHGNVLLRLGDVEAARREFVKATVLVPEYVPAHSNLAAVLLHLGRAEDAEASARQALALNSADTDSLKVLARVCLDGERFAEAVQVYVAVLRLHPDDVETLLVVGNCYAEAGRPEDATTFYQRVLQLDPDNTVAAENMAVVNSKAPAIDRGISTRLPVCCTQTGSEPSDGEPVPVSIIIPVFNRLDLTRQCLESIRRTSPVGRYEIVVVDNGSTDDMSDFLRQQQQAGHLRVVWNKENIGFAKACNQGARAAKSDYLLFLNNDTVPQTGWMEPLCEVLDRDHSVAAVGSKLLFPDGTLQHAGVIVALDERRPSSPLSPCHSTYKQPDHPEANRMRTCQSLTAACLLIRRIAFEKAGGFDEGYWNGYEDVDLCFTLQAQGWKLVYRPESVLIHHESQSGPERHVKEDENLIRLNQRWLGKCEPDCRVKRDGSIIRTDAGRIQMYKLPIEVSPNCLPSPIDGQTGANISGGANQKEETARPVASIIIVTYNSASTIRNCLESVLSCASARIAVIVVDNASTDDTRAILAEHKERITILEHSDNLGFSLACNQGVRASSGEYVVLLNPDTVVTPGWLERMKAHFGQDIGAVGPVSDFAAGLQNIDRHLPEGAPSRMGLLEVTDLLARVNYGKGLQTRLLTGFCMMIPRKVLDEIGLLDETLFLGNDDLDLSWRLREKGYRLVVATDTFVHHKGQVSFKSAPSEQTSRLVQESTDRLYAKLEAHYGNGSVPPPMELWGIDWFRPSHAHFRPQASSPVQGLTSIIILAFNGLEHTIDCLKSINAYTPEPHEIIVVDNGSTDGTVDYLRRYSVKHENIRVIANSSNKGFAAGNNQGLSIARGEYLLLLNNDTMVTSGWLKGMLQLFKQHPDVGIVGPMSNYALEPQLVPDAKYQGIPQMEAFAAKWSADHAGQSLSIKRVVGFCLMTTRRVIDLIGGLDERFGSGNFEDDDLCLRAALAGFQARIAQDVFIHHTGGQTFKIAGIDYSQSLDRNWELFKAKWGIPADAPYEKGYRFPSQTAQGSDLSIPLPDVGADHRCDDQGRWWQEISERPDRSQPAVTEEMPLSVVIVPNGHGLAPLWPSLVQHTKHPLAITILPSHGNGNGDDQAHEVTCPDDWRISTSDLSAVRLFNQLLQSAHDDPVILLSSDLILTPGWLKRLLAAFDRDRHIAVVGPTLNQGPATQRVKADYKGTGKALRQFGLRRAHRYGGGLTEVDSLAPFCIVFKGSACRPIGPLREDLDLAASLHDYFARLRQAGRKVAVILDTYAHYEPHADLPSMGARRADADP